MSNEGWALRIQPDITGPLQHGREGFCAQANEETCLQVGKHALSVEL